MGGSMGSEADSLTKAQKVVAIAAARKDCIAFVSPHKYNQIGVGGAALSTADQRTNTINFFNSVTSSSFAVLDSGFKYMYDRFNDKYRYIPCNGDVAGLCVNVSETTADWIPPAGLNRGGIRNVIKLAFNPNKADRDELYQNRINPIVSFSGTGVVLFGDKTALAAPSAFDRINVRRLFLNVEKRVEALAKGVLFEINDATTRSGFLSTINSYLNEIQSQQGITDFLVICDETNNTPDIIDRNEFVAELFIKPTRSINYVTVTFTATRSGVSFSEVVGR
jgi:phage tail sheath protein FI